MIRKVLFPAFALFVAAALSFGVLHVVEFFFSPYGDLPARRDRGEQYTWGRLVENNEYGFRERSFSTPKPPGTYRIMVLGDSFTWGVGLAAEERYTAIAEELLKETSFDLEFEVLNFGISGLPTTAERDILREYGSRVDPDLVVVGFCYNDPQQRGEHYWNERLEFGRTNFAWRVVNRIRLYLRIAGLPYVADLLRHASYAAAEQAGLIPTWQSILQRSYGPSSEDWRAFVRALQDIKDMSDEMDLPAPVFAVLSHGRHSSDYEEPTGHLNQVLAWDHQAEQAAREVGFVAYNHEHEIPREIRNEPMHVNTIDEHPAANLNRVYGRKLYSKIVEVVEAHHGVSGGAVGW